MTLIGALTVIGWMFTIIPLVVFVLISINLIIGVGKDDQLIMTFSLVGLAVFLMGVTTLLVVYLSGALT